MATKATTPRKKTDAKKSVRNNTGVKPSDILNFSSAIIVVVASAIFYLAGWFYLAHWYTFFSIDVSQLNLPVQLVIIHGIPGVLILSIAGIASASLIAFWKMFSKAERLSVNNMASIVVTAYGIAFFIMLAITISFAFIARTMAIPKEVIWALLISFLLAITISSLYQSSILIAKDEIPVGIDVSGIGAIFIKPSRVYAILRLLPNALGKGDLKTIVRLIAFTPMMRFQLPSVRVVDFLDKAPADPLEKDIALQEDRFAQLIKHQNKFLSRAVTETRQFWVGAVLVLYFLVSISTSALFGDWDAMRGGRFMIGDWKIPEITLFSTSAIPSLEKFETRLNSGYVYKSLGFLTSDDKVYYLVDWKTAEYYQQKPQVYIIPRNDDLILNFIVSPYVAPTATHVPSTQVLTATSTVSVTVTPTP